ncbi:MAG TPA: sulfite exporter TauE/SafE family protein [Flavisolibacter sp.]|nr:sulfite exporter TauE/SafE family protein [Flavisolibacter sp.]
MDVLTIVLLIGLGLLIGCIGTLIGAGGGFILVPILLFVYPDLKPDVVTSISLGVVFLNAFSGSIAYARMKRIDYKSGFIFAAATLPGSIIGAYTTGYLAKGLFDTILGILLIVIAIYLIIRPNQRTTNGLLTGNNLTSRTITDHKGKEYSYSFKLWVGIVISFFVGFLSSLLGIGGGIIHVPALTTLLNFPLHIATATSHFILAVMALGGTIVHIIQGNFKGEWLRTISIGAGIIVGAQVGAYFSNKLKDKLIIRILAFALLAVGVRLLL